MNNLIVNNIFLAVNIATEYGSPWGTGQSKYNLSSFIELILRIGGTIAGVIAIFLILFGGFKIISGASNDDPRATAQGKEAITWAVIGFVIIFGAYFIIRAIELMLGADIITNPNTTI